MVLGRCCGGVGMGTGDGGSGMFGTEFLVFFMTLCMFPIPCLVALFSNECP